MRCDGMGWDDGMDGWMDNRRIIYRDIDAGSLDR